MYNSCGVRNPDSEGWYKRTFHVQKAFWKTKTDVDYEKHLRLVKSLKEELDKIRDGCRMALESAEDFVQKFTLEYSESRCLMGSFVDWVRDISVSCTNSMIGLSERIVSESVRLLKQQPPCSFSAVAIGSLARDEATPYSDLEYMFLVEDVSTEKCQYFEDLAITSYFLMANFRETKLSTSTMNIPELRGWFDDKAQNGFKIDGLGPGAGNIPTGNGTNKGKNFFILTPSELLHRYKETLNNPTEEALRGDLTAMLTYMRSFYTYGKSAEGLLKSVMDEISQIEPGKSRAEANQEMLKNDLKKFNFKPDSKLHDCGFTVDVKKGLYRFPSILLFDLSILWRISGCSSWETADKLLSAEKISAEFHEKLTFLLASACYIRLSAYLHHDSHDDRISVAQRSAQIVSSSVKGRAERRWYVPIGLFSTISKHLFPLLTDLAKIKISEQTCLQTTKTRAADQMLVQAQTLYSCGRYADAFKAISELYGKDLIANPDIVVNDITFTSTNSLMTLDLVADILEKCSHHRAALAFSIHVYNNDFSVKSVKRLADCYSELSNFSQALKILQSSKFQHGEIDLRIGDIYRVLEMPEAAERYLVSALQGFCEEASVEQTYDYYGNIVSKTETKIERLESLTAAERLLHIHNATMDITNTVSTLQYFYFCRGEYELAERYNAKYTQLLTEMYGGEALVIDAVGALCKLANNLSYGPKVEDIYHKSLDLCREIYGRESNHVDIAVLLSNLGNCYTGMNQHQRAMEYYKKSLAMVEEIYGKQEDHILMAQQLRNMGQCYNNTQEFKRAEKFLTESLAMYKRLYGEQSSHRDIADTQIQIGINHKERSQYEQAQFYYGLVLSMYEEKKSTDQDMNLNKAHILCHIGHVYFSQRCFQEARDSYMKALQAYRKTYGSKKHENVANVLLWIGNNLKRQHMYVAASEYYSQSLAMYREIFEDIDSPKSLATTLNDHGDKYESMEWYDHAAELYKEALHVYRLVYGEDNENIAQTLQKIGQNFHSKEDYTAAEDFYHQALAIYQKISESDSSHTGVADTLNYLGLNCSEKGEHCLSEGYLKKALASYQQTYISDTNHSDIALVLNNMGYNYNGMGKHEEATACLLQSLDMRYALHGSESNHEEIASVLYNLGYNYCDMKEHELSEDCLLRSLTMYKEMYGDNCDDTEVAKVLNDLGANYTEWGKYERATPYYHQTIRMEKALHGEDCQNVPIARALTNQGHNQQRLKEYEAAEESFSESLVMYKHIHHSEPNIVIAETYRHLGKNYQSMSKHAQAEESYEKGLALTEQLQKNEKVTLTVADILDCLGTNFTDMEQYSKSDECLHKALQIYRDFYGEQTIEKDIAKVLGQLAFNANLKGDYAASETYHNECIVMERELVKSGQNVGIATTLYNLAENYKCLKQYDEAQQLLSEALDTFENNNSEENDQLDRARTLCALGDCHKETYSYEKAEEYYNCALEIYRTWYAAVGDRQSLAGELIKHSTRLRGIKEYQKALLHLNEALSILNELDQGDGKSHDMAEAYQQIGYNCDAIEDYNSAIENFSSALEIFKSIHGEKHEDVGDTLHGLGNAYSNVLEFQKADECLHRALDIFKELGHSERTSSALGNLGSSYRERGDFRKASEMFQEAVKLNRTIHGEGHSHESTAFSLSKLGDNYIDLGEFDEATKLLKESLEMYREVYGKGTAHPDVAKILYVLGVTYVNWAKPGESIEYLQQGVEMKLSLYGEYNESVALDHFNLSQAHMRLGNLEETRKSGQKALDIYHLISPEHENVTALYEMLIPDDASQVLQMLQVGDDGCANDDGDDEYNYDDLVAMLLADDSDDGDGTDNDASNDEHDRDELLAMLAELPPIPSSSPTSSSLPSDENNDDGGNDENDHDNDNDGEGRQP